MYKPVRTGRDIAVVHVVQKCYSDFELQGVSETVLKSKIYQTISSRLQVTFHLSFTGNISPLLYATKVCLKKTLPTSKQVKIYS